MLITLSLKSKTVERNGVILTVAQLIIRKGEFLSYFKNNSNLVLDKQVENVVTKLRTNKDKIAILKINQHRKEREEERQNQYFATSSGDLSFDNYYRNSIHGTFCGIFYGI